MSDSFELSNHQRDALLVFLTHADATFGDGSFDPQTDWSAPELIALALRAAQLLGYEGASLEALFEREFSLSGITEGNLGTVLVAAMMSDVEKRVRAAAGGKN